MEEFAGFGPSRVHPLDFRPELGRLPGTSMLTFREAVKTGSPKLPGVYGMIDGKGRLIYVGKAKELRTRLMSYCRDKRDHKAGRILHAARTIVWERAPNEFAALLRELELIRRHRPRFNVQGQPDSRKATYLVVGRSPAPYLHTARQPTGKEIAFYGPVPSASRASEACRRLNDITGLRDCSQRVKMHFRDQPPLFGEIPAPKCLRLELGTCAGPCAGACSRREYASRVRKLRDFLEGNNPAILDDLETEMRSAAAALQFERALALRERWEQLRWLADRLGWLRLARERHSFIYPLAGDDGRTVWYMIHRGQVVSACYRPETDESRAALLPGLAANFTATAGEAGTLAAGAVDSVLLVSSWFRKHSSEREALLLPGQGEEYCRAGTLSGPARGGSQLVVAHGPETDQTDDEREHAAEDAERGRPVAG